MNEQTVLNMIRLPARLNVEQVAAVLGFTVLEIPILMQAKMLKPLGDPPPNGHKFFAAQEISKLADDPEWLGKASKAVNRHWRAKNQRRQHPVSVGSSSSPSKVSPRQISLSANPAG